MPRQKSGNYNDAEYKKTYQREHIVFRKMNFNTSNEDDIKLIQWIEQQPEGTSPYLKKLVQKDMEAHFSPASADHGEQSGQE